MTVLQGRVDLAYRVDGGWELVYTVYPVLHRKGLESDALARPSGGRVAGVGEAMARAVAHGPGPPYSHADQILAHSSLSR